MTTTPADRPPLDLDAIRRRIGRITNGPNWPLPRQARSRTTDALELLVDHDVPALLDEVTALRAELDAARAAWGEASDVAVDGLLRAEDRRSALADREADAARAERTEPATGEDVDQARAEVAHILTTWWESDGYESPGQLADRILAALVPPGREQALREENERERELREANARECDRLSAVVDELGVALNTAAAERDAANAALDVARLLDEARMERDKARAELAYERDIAGRLEDHIVDLEHATAEAAPDGDGAA